MEVKSVAFTLTKHTHTQCVNIERERHPIADSNARADYWRERYPGPDNACNPLQSDFLQEQQMFRELNTYVLLAGADVLSN